MPGATLPLGVPHHGVGCDPWAVRGQFHWELDDVRPLPDPVPCRGALGLWRLPEDVEKAVREQLEAARDVTATTLRSDEGHE